ncbi:CBO0543 family protein [Cytobacillus oceanisediminis]|uniref:CBO0543 family protein n=1 Tax=Cytobacillus oceanisediminis TaxID=665099 RepID=UPI002810BC2D|nr:CBO0543 family protein [Cytobacillus oceanisediminis]
MRKGYLKYPVNLFKTFDVSVLFSYIIFPITCVYFNQLTRTSGKTDILLKCLFFTAPSAFAELILKRIHIIILGLRYIFHFYKRLFIPRINKVPKPTVSFNAALKKRGGV